MKNRIKHSLDEHFALKKVLDDNIENMQKAAALLITCYENKKKVLICGNGGSAGDAQHFAAELVGRFKKERKALPAMALTTDSSVITAVANDYGFEEVFSRQLEAQCEQGDVVVVITTSGKSPNVLKAVQTAKKLKANTIALNGKDGGALHGMTDVEILIAGETPRIQEAHILCIHIICDLVEEALFPDD